MKKLSWLFLPLILLMLTSCEDDPEGDKDVYDVPTLTVVESKVEESVSLSFGSEPNFAYELYLDFENNTTRARTYTIKMTFNSVSDNFGAGFCTTTLCYSAQRDDFHPVDDPFTLQPGQKASEVFQPGLVSGEKHGFSIDFYPDVAGTGEYTSGSVDVLIEFINVDDPNDVLTQQFTFDLNFSI